MFVVLSKLHKDIMLNRKKAFMSQRLPEKHDLFAVRLTKSLVSGLEFPVWDVESIKFIASTRIVTIVFFSSYVNALKLLVNQKDPLASLAATTTPFHGKMFAIGDR